MVFVFGVLIGVLNILSKQVEDKVNANTRGTSVESKIHPKNTQGQRENLR